jgi:tetratricopeptide (TPR) repeat protein
MGQLGQFPDAVARAKQAFRIAESMGQPYSIVMGHRAIGFVNLLMGKLDVAIPALERALDVCQTAKLSLVFDGTASALGHAYALAGRLAEGTPLLERAVQQPAATGTDYHSFFMSRLSEAYLLEGRWREASAVAERALTLSRQCSEHGNEAWILRVLGEIAVRRDPLDAAGAEQHYRRALALASEHSMRPLVAHCHFGLGTLYRGVGSGERARSSVTTAASMYRDMGMALYLDQAETALSSLR